MTALQKFIASATVIILVGAGTYYSLRSISDRSPTPTVTNSPNPNTTLNPGPSSGMSPEIQTLLLKLNSPDPEARLYAIQAIGYLGPKGAEAVPSLIPLLDDQERSVRVLTAHALGKIGPAASRALPALRKQAQLRKAAEQSTANRAIRKIEN